LALIRFVSALAIFLAWTPGFAAGPQPGNSLPLLTIEDRGELVLESNEIHYQPWSSERSPGTVHIVQYLAGTRSASGVFRPFTDELKNTFTFTDYHVTTIINLDDALWGTGGLVVSEVESNKRQYPLATMVLDESGIGRKSWGLTKKGAAVFILDKEGTVLHLLEDTMSDQQLQHMLELVSSQIES
jgi:uncharacterized protein